MPWVLCVCGIISFFGALLTVFFVEDRRGKGMAESEHIEDVDDHALLDEESSST